MADQQPLLIHKRPAGHGILWLREGWQHFKQSPINWLVMSTLLLGGLFLGLMIPLAGLLVQIILPCFSAGLLLAAQQLHRGQGIHIGYLLAGFSQRRNELITLGVINLLANFAILILTAVVVALGGGAENAEALSRLQPGDAIPPEMYNLMLMILLVATALSIPLVMAMWFAPALICLSNMKALDAFRTSFIACNRNLLPFLLYGLITLPLLIAAALPMGLGFPILIPVIIGSMYAGWRDVFATPASTQNDG